jgi:hypothetical protein
MDEAYAILDYLPNSFKEPGEQEYITFLWDAFDSNYENGQFQMALLPYHMLYMSFVYFSIWQIKLMRPVDFSHATIFQKNEKQVNSAPSPFVFHKVAESEVFKFLRIIGCSEEQTRCFAELVVERNKLAHANGLIVCTGQQEADQKVGAILEQMEAIQQHMAPLLHQCLKSFLIDSAVPQEDREYEDPEDQIREMLVHKHYFSKRDIEACRSFDIHALSTELNYPEIEVLFRQFVDLYATECTE